ncbi:helix-turn-helix domain-containing protein [Mycetocola reblochoni]|uniref:helix-turn-helix domain-containing protein n=1 Tax=Mycetocola reblochoni TaxID=331618 RepID=UPI003F9E4456
MMLRIEFPPALMTKDLAAHYLSKSEREIDELRAAGHLIPVGNGRRITFTKEELDRYVESLPERDV